MTNGKTADLILKTRTDKSREYWINLYNEYFNYNSDWNEFWKIVEESA